MNQLMLDQLAEAEMVLMRRVRELGRMPNSEATATAYDEVYSAYREIHRTYALAAATNLEALKRGLFIQWFAFADPHWITGINELDFDAEQLVMAVVNERLQSGALDSELRWMLTYYVRFGVYESGYYRFLHLEALAAFVRDVDGETAAFQWPPDADSAQMSRRGQMGAYWAEMLRA